MSVAPFPGGKIPRQTKRPYHEVVLTPEQEAWLRKYFPTNRGDILREKMGLSLTTFYRVCKTLGIKKTDAVRARIWRASSRKGAKTCRQNGYYDSVKGKQPSPQCVEAVKERWKLVKEGKALSPLAQLKKHHPQRYKNACKKLSDNKKRLFKMEKLRLMSGMKQVSKLRNIRVTPYTRSQTSHRHSALERGYWYYKGCAENDPERWNIYYDEGTQRAPIFEENLVKDGFRVLDGRGL